MHHTNMHHTMQQPFRDAATDFLVGGGANQSAVQSIYPQNQLTGFRPLYFECLCFKISGKVTKKGMMVTRSLIFRIELRDLSHQNCGQKRPKIFNLREKASQIRGEIGKFKDFDGRYLLWQFLPVQSLSF